MLPGTMRPVSFFVPISLLFIIMSYKRRRKAQESNDQEEDLFEQYCQVSSCMGVIDFYQSRHLASKFFWGTLLTVCLLFTSYQVYNCCEQIINGPAFETSVSQEPQPEGVPFPKITLCNYNRAKQSVINKTGIDPRVLTYMFTWFPTSSYDMPLTLFGEEIVREHEKAWLDYMSNGTSQKSYFEILRTFGHGKDMFIKTSFNNYIIYSVNHNYTEVFTKYGRCWQIPVPFKKQKMPGSYFGLKTIVDPQLDEYMINGSLNNYLKTGIVLSLSYADEPLMPNPVSIAPGTAASVALRLSSHKFTKSQPSLRHFRCTSNLSLEYIDAQYTVQNCAFDCYVKATIKICNCIKLAIIKGDYPMCNFTNGANCDDNFIATNSSLLDMYQECARKCLPPCSDFYTLEHIVSTTSYADKTSTQQLANLLQPFKPDYSRQKVLDMIKNAISIEIYFDTLDMFITETKESIPLITFIGNFGGQLGLLTGSSVLTVVQCIYYTILWCMSRKCRRERDQPKVPSVKKKNKIGNNHNPRKISKGKRHPEGILYDDSTYSAVAPY